VYLDNAATSYPKPESVYEAVLHAMRDVGASPRPGRISSVTGGWRILFQAREAAARFFRFRFGSDHFLRRMPPERSIWRWQGTLTAGDHVITTSMEHNSLLRPLYALRNKGC